MTGTAGSKSPRDQFLPAIREIQSFLERPDALLPGPEDRAGLAGRAAALAAKIKDADDRVCLGLVGGTGVGKSTLINALAGRQISSSTDLRPTTDRLVVYRYRGSNFSLDAGEEVHEHDSPALEKVVLADFPDFDSLEPEHRRVLARHFSDLDLLLWVADPVKYADQTLFDWMKLAPQASVNSIFIFNKIDELKARYGGDGHKTALEAAADFREKLVRHAGLEEPVVIPLSALEAFKQKAAPEETGLAALTERIEQLSEKKLRLSIKALNLEEQTRSLRRDFVNAADPDQAATWLRRLREALQRGRRDADNLIDAEAARLGSTLGRAWRRGLSAGAREKAPWPLDFFIFIWDGLRGLVPGSRDKTTGAPALPRPELAGLGRRLETWQAEMGASFGPGENHLRRDWQKQGFGPTGVPDLVKLGEGNLAAKGAAAAARIAKKHRWRLRHHLLPVLVLIYPILPLILSWLPVGVSSGASTTDITLYVSWRDLVSVLEVVIGLYVLQSIYFAYSLDRKAGRVLAALIDEWAAETKNLVRTNVDEPAEKFIGRLEGQIEAVRSFR